MVRCICMNRIIRSRCPRMNAGISLALMPAIRSRSCRNESERAVHSGVDMFLRRISSFMLVSALMGLDTMKSAYAHAIASGYRFYSYGDSSLLLPERS